MKKLIVAFCVALMGCAAHVPETVDGGVLGAKEGKVCTESACWEMDYLCDADGFVIGLCRHVVDEPWTSVTTCDPHHAPVMIAGACDE